MPSRNLDDLTQDTRDAFEQLRSDATAEGIDVLVTHTLRTCAEQDALYAQGRTTPGPRVTGAPGCRSWHTHGRAVDVLVREPDGAVVHDGTDSRYAWLGARAEQLGFRWGGRFGDPGHFEFHPNLSISQVCPDPADCSHLGQPRSGPPPLTQAPSRLGGAGALGAAVVGVAAYLAADWAWGLTPRLSAVARRALT